MAFAPPLTCDGEPSTRGMRIMLFGALGRGFKTRIGVCGTTDAMLESDAATLATNTFSLITRMGLSLFAPRI